MQKVFEKSCFEKKPTSSAFWRVSFTCGGLCTPTAQAAWTRPLSRAPGLSSPWISICSGLLSPGLGFLGFRCLCLGCPLLPAYSLSCKTPLCFGFQQRPPGHQGSVLCFDGLLPDSALSSRTPSSLFPPISLIPPVPSVGPSPSSSPPFLPQLSRLRFQDGSQSLCFSCLHPWGPDQRAHPWEPRASQQLLVPHSLCPTVCLICELD